MTTAADLLDHIDKTLLVEVRTQFPIDHRPFDILAHKIDVTEQACLERIAALKAIGVIRRIGAVFDGAALGYQSCVVAMKVDSVRLDAAAERVAQHPGVSYISIRNDAFNFWFALAVPPPETLQQVVRILQRLVDADEGMTLPVLKLYKAGEDVSVSAQEALLDEDVARGGEVAPQATSPRLSDQDVRFVRILQGDLPLMELPFTVVAEQTESTEEELFAWMRNAQRQDLMRRFAANIAPRPAQASMSAVIVWQVPESQVDAVGEEVARIRGVQLCYRRPVYSHWPYPLFTVIRGATESTCMDAVKRIEERIGRFVHKHLFRVKDYPPKPCALFPPELEAWWNTVGDHVQLP